MSNKALIKQWQQFMKSSPFGVGYAGAVDGEMNDQLHAAVNKLEQAVQNQTGEPFIGKLIGGYILIADPSVVTKAQQRKKEKDKKPVPQKPSSPTEEQKKEEPVKGDAMVTEFKKFLSTGNGLTGPLYQGDVNSPEADRNFVLAVQNLENAIAKSVDNAAIRGSIWNGNKIATTVDDVKKAIQLINQNKEKVKKAAFISKIYKNSAASRELNLNDLDPFAMDYLIYADEVYQDVARNNSYFMTERFGIGRILRRLGMLIRRRGSPTNIEEMKAFMDVDAEKYKIPKDFIDKWHIFRDALSIRIQQAENDYKEYLESLEDEEVYDEDLTFHDELAYHADFGDDEELSPKTMRSRAKRLRALLKLAQPMMDAIPPYKEKQDLPLGQDVPLGMLQVVPMEFRLSDSLDPADSQQHDKTRNLIPDKFDPLDLEDIINTDPAKKSVFTDKDGQKIDKRILELGKLLEV